MFYSLEGNLALTGTKYMSAEENSILLYYFLKTFNNKDNKCNTCTIPMKEN